MVHQRFIKIVKKMKLHALSGIKMDLYYDKSCKFSNNYHLYGFPYL